MHTAHTYTRLGLEDLLKDKKVGLEVTPEAADWLANEGYSHFSLSFCIPFFDLIYTLLRKE
jgi:hypothetical protein